MEGSRSDDAKRPGWCLIVAAVLGGGLWAATACEREPGEVAKAADVSWFGERGCTSCHVDGEEVDGEEVDGEEVDGSVQATCTGCHVRTGVRARDEGEPRQPAPALYGTAPSLAQLAALEPKKFTAQGLRRMLAVPEARMSRAVSMFPLYGKDAETVVDLLAMRPGARPGSAASACAPSGASLHARGQALYERLGCRSCHEEARIGPRLRLGYRLLSAGFFAGKLRDPRRGRWPGAHAQAMPAFPALSDCDIEAIHGYVSSTRDQAASRPLRATAPLSVSSVLLDSHLYDFVARALLQASCRHCHSTAPAARREMRAVFPPRAGPPRAGHPGSGAAPAFGIEREESVLGFAAASAAVLHPGPGCSESLLVRRLRARWQEWAGEPAEMPGMPLTLAPLDPDVIRVIDVWTKRGCPSPQGNLCRRCEVDIPPGHAGAH